MLRCRILHLLSRRAKPIQRDPVLAKTGSRCHICGGKIEGKEWSADHVFAHSQGGQHALDNYLPAHNLCNTYRWFYGAEEFQCILKLGVWLRTFLETEKPLSMTLSDHFLKYERRRDSRSVNGGNGKQSKNRLERNDSRRVCVSLDGSTGR